jgi:hypothetical protein
MSKRLVPGQGSERSARIEGRFMLAELEHAPKIGTPGHQANRAAPASVNFT